jgi:glycerophosphoryl diester phosphodiesterase
MLRYPENTLPGIEAALKAGACGVEFDVHLCKEGVPVVHHDADLKRTAGVDKSIFTMTLEEVKSYSVHEPDRLGDEFHDVRIATLQKVVQVMRQWPHVLFFVEIKRKSLNHFGNTTVVECIMEVIKPVIEQCVIISFDRDAVDYARTLGAKAIGWVAEEWNEEVRAAVEELAPDYLFAEDTCFENGEEPLPQGDWQWVIYDVMSPELALELAARGADMIETGAIGEMLAHPVLAQKRCHQ